MHAIATQSSKTRSRAVRPSLLRARSRWPACIRKAFALLLAAVAVGMVAGPVFAAPQTPNILFVIMDDVGIDQMRLFGYGGATPPSTPTIDRIAGSGVRFTNTWSMPTCSASRSTFFTGRYPLRTRVYGALGPDDLANSQVSPFETTLPRLLKERGYKSALFGKFHLGLQGHNPFGYSMVQSLGWDYFYGWLDETGDPSSIDTTAGGVAPVRTWTCGFVPGASDGGADQGACYAADNTCQAMNRSGPIPPGRICRDNGGIFDPNRQCQTPRPANINFSTLSGHYVSPLVINHEDGTVEQVPFADIRARTYRGTVPVDAAIDWINRQPRDKPWMATVSFASAHTPVMQPPPALLGPGTMETSGLDCANPVAQRAITNQMIEAMDTEVGRLLVETGLVRRGPDGSLSYDPAQTDTMLIVVGDNGTFGGAVKAPFDSGRAKGTVYQTGVWVPLVIAGPLVNQPNRSVKHMANTVDLYQLFGEMAGIDVPRAVPRTIDSAALLPYLANPRQGSIRRWNFTQAGPNLQANNGINGPCTIQNSCTQIPVTKSVCEDNGGIWWGQGSTVEGIPAGGFKLCCEVNTWLGQPTYVIQPLSAVAIRNDRYKLVKNSYQDYDAASNSCVAVETDELYAIDEAVPVPTLDREGTDLKAKGPLTLLQQLNYVVLTTQLAKILDSQPACPGDGNIDGEVNGQDIMDWQVYRALARGESSWYDLNLDGLTNTADLAIVQQNLGTQCRNRQRWEFPRSID